MALDIQPLSPQRRAAMVFVLLGVLAISLAFAQTLVNRRTTEIAQPTPSTIQNMISFSGPPGFAQPSEFFEQFPNLTLSGSGSAKVPSPRPRQFGLFSFRVDDPPSGKALHDQSVELMSQIIGDDLDEMPPPSLAFLADKSALEMDAVYPSPFGAGDSAFLMQRLAMLPEESAGVPPAGRVVAICYSGNGPITDADKTFFDTLCKNCLHITTVQTR